jgi:hypothetical protein
MFTLKQLRKQIWHLHFDKHYDLTMHFLRYQEFYESPKFKKMNMTLVNLMDWYSQNMGDGVFSYPKDWAGFNLPGEQIFNCHRKGIEDKNRYDRMMFSIAEFICAKEDNQTNFYIIGTSEEDVDFKSTFNHELAHGFFFANEKYKKQSAELVNNLNPRTRSFIFKKLKESGYLEDFFIDETQAYLSTGIIDQMKKPSVIESTEPFEKLFKKFTGKLRKK